MTLGSENRRSQDELKTAILQSFRSFDPERIVLFGSRARGSADEYSDIDLIVVYATEKRFLDRLEELYLAWSLPIPVDILAYTPEEYRSMSRNNEFVRQAVAEGEVLYERG